MNKVMTIFLLAAVVLGCNRAESLHEENLVGDWIRPDGGYLLSISKTAKDGGLDCGYFNPDPIRVSQAKWRSHNDELQLYVELRDVNYPGSTYSLTHDPAADKLVGTYYQAAIGQTFGVEFARKEAD